MRGIQRDIQDFAISNREQTNNHAAIMAYFMGIQCESNGDMSIIRRFPRLDLFDWFSWINSGRHEETIVSLC